MASRFWVGGAGNWDTSTTHWSASSGGSGGASAPGASDDVFFDGNSGSGTVVAQFSGKTIGSINCTGYSGGLDLSTANGVDLVLQSGDAIFDPGMTYIDAEEAAIEFAGSGTQFFTTNGVPMPLTAWGRSTNNSGITKLGSSAQVLSVGCFQGIVDFNGFDLQCRYMQIQANLVTRTSEARFGTGTITVGSVSTMHAPFIDIGGSFPANVTITPGSSKIVLTNTLDNQSTYFNGAGFTFNNVEIGQHIGQLTEIIGSNTFNDFKIDGPGMTVQFDAGTTQTVNSLTVPANPLNAINLVSKTRGSQWNISDTSGTNRVYGCSISDSVASGGATFVATGNQNVNQGNNSGWIFDQQILFARSAL